MNEDIQIEVGREGEALEVADAFDNVAKQLHEVVNNIEAAEDELYPDEVDLTNDDDLIVDGVLPSDEAVNFTRLQLRQESFLRRILPSSPEPQRLIHVGNIVTVNAQGEIVLVSDVGPYHSHTAGTVIDVRGGLISVRWNHPIGAAITEHSLPSPIQPAPPVRTMRLEVYQTADGQMVLRDEVTKAIVSNISLESMDHQTPHQEFYSLGSQQPYRVTGLPSVRLVSISTDISIIVHESAPTPPAAPLPEVTIPPQSESTREIEVSL